jgi:RNA polymerase sigma factor (sigma-70 family)
MEPPQTPKTLLSTLSKDFSNQVLWTQLIHLYEPLIRFWLALKGVPADDIADCTQQVLLRLVRLLQQTGYQANRARFRTLLGTIVHSVAIDAYRKTRHLPHPDTTPLEDIPDTHSDVPAKIEAQIQIAALETVLESIRSGHIPLTPIQRDVFDACIDNDESPTTFAQQRGLRVNTVIQIRKRLIRKIRKLANAY